jgi:hypothetical protein
MPKSRWVLFRMCPASDTALSTKASALNLVEGAVLPLTGSAWITAGTFTVLNAALLTVRIWCKTRALAAASAVPVS